MHKQLLLRIGRISFIHNDPAFYYLEKGRLNDVLIKSATPRELLELLLREELDFAPISSIALHEHRDKLTPVPALAVHSEGPARSALLIARKDQPEVLGDGEKIAITNYTETSAGMLRVLLRKKNINADFIQSKFTSAKQLLQEAPYALVIGNEALATFDDYGQKIFDLGEEWGSITQQPAVFALSAIRFGLLEHSETVDRIVRLVRESLEFGYANLGQIIKNTAEWSRMSPDLLAEYFVSLRLDYTERAAKGYEYLVNMLDSNSHNL